MGKRPRVDRTEVADRAERNQLGKFDEGQTSRSREILYTYPYGITAFRAQTRRFQAMASRKENIETWPVADSARRELLLRLRNSH
jgi:hypothetical protein